MKGHYVFFTNSHKVTNPYFQEYIKNVAIGFYKSKLSVDLVPAFSFKDSDETNPKTLINRAILGTSLSHSDTDYYMRSYTCSQQSSIYKWINGNIASSVYLSDLGKTLTAFMMIHRLTVKQTKSLFQDSPEAFTYTIDNLYRAILGLDTTNVPKFVLYYIDEDSPPSSQKTLPFLIRLCEELSIPLVNLADAQATQKIRNIANDLDILGQDVHWNRVRYYKNLLTPKELEVIYAKQDTPLANPFKRDPAYETTYNDRTFSALYEHDPFNKN